MRFAKKATLLSLLSVGTLLGLTALPSVSAMAATAPTTLYVSTSGSDTSGNGTATAPYATIQKAVDEAASGDTILIQPGTYDEMVTVSEPLTIEAAPGYSSPVVIDAAGEANGILINSSNVTIHGLTIENANDAGLLAVGTQGTALTNLTIDDNILEDNSQTKPPAAIGDWETLHLEGVDNSRVVGNQVIDNLDGGIYLTDETAPTTGNVVADNIVKDNKVDCGITLAAHVPGHGVENNIITGNQSIGNGAAGIMMATAVPGAIVKGNVAVGNTVVGNGLGGIGVHTHAPGSIVENNVIVHNTVSDNAPDFGVTTAPTGIDVGALGSPITGTIIANNSISGETDGINVTALAQSTTVLAGLSKDTATIPVSHVPAIKYPAPTRSPFSGKNAYITGVSVAVEASGQGALISAQAATAGQRVVEYEFLVQTPTGTWMVARPFATSNSFTYNASAAGTYHVQVFALTEYQLAHKTLNEKVGSLATPWKA